MPPEHIEQLLSNLFKPLYWTLGVSLLVAYASTIFLKITAPKLNRRARGAYVSIIVILTMMITFYIQMKK